jgi:SET domain-containing protein
MDSIRTIFAQRGLVYLERSRIADRRVSDRDWGTSPYYEANRSEFESLTARYGADLRAGRRAVLEVRTVGEEVGLGLFAGDDLAAGDLLGEYTGVIQESGDAPPDQLVDGHYLSDYAWNYPDELDDGTEFEVNALQEGNELRFANHSSRPNLAVDHTLVDGIFVTFFRVTEAVSRGEQLFVDYGDEYWEGGFRSRRDL